MARTATRRHLIRTGPPNLEPFGGPDDISNMVLHLDASVGSSILDNTDSPASDGEQVKTWNDISGESHHVAQNFPYQPTYRTVGMNGLPSIEFGLTTDPLWSGSFLDSSYNTAATVFWIGEQTSGESNNMVVSAAGLATGNMQNWCRFDVANLTADPSWWTHSIYNGAQIVLADHDRRCVGVSYDGICLRMIINGHLVKRYYTGNLGLTDEVTIGDYPEPAGAGPFHGYISEVLMWKSAMTDSQMRNMCTWLLNKWQLSAPTLRNIMCYVGDSQTNNPGTEKWPEMIATELGTVKYSHTSVAQAGVTLQAITAIASTWVDVLLDSGQARRVNAIWAGTNDLSGGTSGADVYAHLVSYCNARRAAGWNRIAVFTALPRSEVGIVPGHEARRQAFNTLVRANYTTFADGLVDVAADSRIGDDGDELDRTYYDSDRVHLVNAGQAVVTELASPVIDALV